MLSPVKNVEDLQKLNELISLKSQVNEVRLQDKLVEQNFHEDKTKVIKPVTKPNKDLSETVTKTKTETSNIYNKALENINNKLLELMNDRGVIASLLIFFSSKITNPEKHTQFRLVNDSSSSRVNDLSIHNTIPITLYNNLLTFRDPSKLFELNGDFLKMITNKNYNVDLASLQDKKVMYDFAKEMYFDVRAPGNKSNRDRLLIKLLRSATIVP